MAKQKEVLRRTFAGLQLRLLDELRDAGCNLVESINSLAASLNRRTVTEFLSARHIEC